MENILIQDRIVIHSFKDHYKYKNKILDSINLENGLSLSDKNQNINKTDWMIEKTEEKEWMKIFLKNFYNELSYVYEKMGYKNLLINNYWFQEYNKQSFHSWHTHGQCNFSNVYFLELPEDSSPTEFLLFNNTEKKIDAKEGDLIVFPAHILHRAPINFSDKKRTVIVFNSSIDMDMDIYG